MDQGRQQKLETELREMLGDHFEDLKVTVEKNARWDRMSATFVSPEFVDLLPEERYQRLCSILSEEFRTTKLKGFVWLELAPGETVDSFLKLPRSEDLEPREGKVYEGLQRVKFFEKLSESLGRSPKKKCTGDFAALVEILGEKKFTSAKIQEAKLLFIRYGAYCDCQALESVAPELAEKHGRM